MDVQDRVAVVTGASRGLGAGVARDFFRRGMRLGLCARSEPVLPDGDRVVAARVDVTDGDAVDRFAADVAARLGRIDLWINNAGVLAPIAPLRDIDSADYRHHLDVNVVGVFHGTRAYVRHVRATGGPGVLINISSGAAHHGYAGWSAYCAGKAAVDLLTECVALEEKDSGLRAHAVAPGVIDTAMQELIRGMPRERFPAVDRFVEMKRTNAFSTPEYVAGELLDLAFDPSRAGESRVRFPPEPRG